jgi:hypothetical protein
VPSRESSLRNLEKALANWRRPRPWRSGQETRVIRRLVWQWFIYRGPDKWSGRGVGRWLRVSHTYIQKLIREFKIDSSDMQRLYRNYGQATFQQLSDAQEVTQKQRAWGMLRSPRLWKATKFEVADEVMRTIVRTKASYTVPKARFAAPQGAPPFASERTGPYYFPVRRPRRPWRPGMRYW